MVITKKMFEEMLNDSAKRAAEGTLQMLALVNLLVETYPPLKDMLRLG